MLDKVSHAVSVEARMFMERSGIMHLIKDENGNVVSHGHGEHGCPHSHDPDHEHCGHHHDGEGACGDCKNETVALLAYMVQHNEHHAAELDQMADNLEKMDLMDAAKTIRDGVADFQKANMRFSLALTLVKEQIKEA